MLCSTGLPDGIFAYQKSQFWYIFEGLLMFNFDVFYGHLVQNYQYRKNSKTFLNPLGVKIWSEFVPSPKT
jgi:hypothetical protein